MNPKSIIAIGGATALAIGLAGVILTPGGSLETLDGCGPFGNAPFGSLEAGKNVLKNRFILPSAADLDPAATLPTMAQSQRGELNENTAGEITGFIVEVKPGGVESCNCHATAPDRIDTHIYLGPKADSPKRECVVVEVTPRLRMSNQENWSENALKLMTGKRVRVTGWLFYDAEHEGSAENIKSRPENWRASCWEIHPVTKIEILPKI